MLNWLIGIFKWMTQPLEDVKVQVIFSVIFLLLLFFLGFFPITISKASHVNVTIWDFTAVLSIGGSGGLFLCFAFIPLFISFIHAENRNPGHVGLSLAGGLVCYPVIFIILTSLLYYELNVDLISTAERHVSLISTGGSWLYSSYGEGFGFVFVLIGALFLFTYRIFPLASVLSFALIASAPALAAGSFIDLILCIIICVATYVAPAASAVLLRERDVWEMANVREDRGWYDWPFTPVFSRACRKAGEFISGTTGFFFLIWFPRGD